MVAKTIGKQEFVSGIRPFPPCLLAVNSNNWLCGGFMKVTILVDAIDPFYDVLFTTNVKYLSNARFIFIDFTDEECERVRKFTKEMDSIQKWLQEKFNSA